MKSLDGSEVTGICARGRHYFANRESQVYIEEIIIYLALPHDIAASSFIVGQDRFSYLQEIVEVTA